MKQLTKVRQVHIQVDAMFCCRNFYCVPIKHHCRHQSTKFLTTQTDQSEHNILIDYVLNDFWPSLKRYPLQASKQWKEKYKQLTIVFNSELLSFTLPKFFSSRKSTLVWESLEILYVREAENLKLGLSAFVRLSVVIKMYNRYKSSYHLLASRIF